MRGQHRLHHLRPSILPQWSREMPALRISNKQLHWMQRCHQMHPMPKRNIPRQLHISLLALWQYCSFLRDMRNKSNMYNLYYNLFQERSQTMWSLRHLYPLLHALLNSILLLRMHQRSKSLSIEHDDLRTMLDSYSKLHKLHQLNNLQHLRSISLHNDYFDRHMHLLPSINTALLGMLDFYVLHSMWPNTFFADYC